MQRLVKAGNAYPPLLEDGKTKTLFILGGETETGLYDNVEPERAKLLLNDRHCYGTHLSGDVGNFGIGMPSYEIYFEINLPDMMLSPFAFY